MDCCEFNPMGLVGNKAWEVIWNHLDLILCSSWLLPSVFASSYRSFPVLLLSIASHAIGHWVSHCPWSNQACCYQIDSSCVYYPWEEQSLCSEVDSWALIAEKWVLALLFLMEISDSQQDACRILMRAYHGLWHSKSSSSLPLIVHHEPDKRLL